MKSTLEAISPKRQMHKSYGNTMGLNKCTLKLKKSLCGMKIVKYLQNYIHNNNLLEEKSHELIPALAEVRLTRVSGLTHIHAPTCARTGVKT
jgi:hypothetical protein